MKLVELKCKSCGAELSVDSDGKEVVCQYCGNKMLIDDEIKHIQYDNMEQAGYDYEKGKLRALREEEEYKSQKEESKKIQELKAQDKLYISQCFQNNWFMYLISFIYPPVTLILLGTTILNTPNKTYTKLGGIITSIGVVFLIVFVSIMRFRGVL